MKISSANTGFLKATDVKSGDKVLIYSEAKENEFSFTNDEGKLVEGMDWRVKVKLPDGTKKLAIISAFSHDAILERYGNESQDWIGHTLECEITKWNKVAFKPTSDPKVENPSSDLSTEDKAEIKALREAESAERQDDTPSSEKVPF